MKRPKAKQKSWQDHYTRQAKKERFPARSVYKLEEIQKKHRLIKKGNRVLDLGCSPGSWLLYAAKLVGPEGRVGVKEIEGGNFAVFRLKGPFDQFSKAYSAIFREWYPTSGYELREAPLREKYINYSKKRKPEKYITDLYLPIK